MSINSLKHGEKGIIQNIEGDSKLVKRLFALGCIEGTEIQLKRTAPLGDPLIINVRGFDLAIRKRDAESIKIVK